MRLHILFLYSALCAILWTASLGARAISSAQVIRLDDQLSQASVKASAAASSALSAEPIVWQNFFSTSDISWQLVRGRIGVRNGDLIVQGGGSTPVILAPKQPAVDWSLYQAVEIRMSAQGGRDVKIKIGDFEAVQKLGPVGQYNVYRFDVNIDAPKGSRLLGIMPTDSLGELVAIRSIKLIPKKAKFSSPAGHDFLGKRDEYRNALYVRSPSSLIFSVTLPLNAHLHFGIGATSIDSPVKFRVSIEGSSNDLFSEVFKDTEHWQDADLDLSRWSGQTVKLQFRTDSEKAGNVSLWANPLITTTVKKPRPNILIYTIDTLRADHASVCGYTRDTTPFLSKLGATGIVFDDCQAQATWTKSSIASLMTSLYSFTHGIISDADTIPQGANTLAEQLRNSGYVTASIVSTPYVGRATGLEKGFDYLLEYPIVTREVNAQSDRSTDSMALNRVAFPWLEKHHDEPFFLYLHATDPHAPYDPPPPFDGAFANPAETALFEKNYAGFRTMHAYGGGAVITPQICQRAGINPDSFIRQAVDRYDGEIRHNDRSLQLLLGKMKELGVLENTLVIVLSDHGEEFWDHGWTAHGHSVYQELTHCLLLMWNPSLLPSARRVGEPVQLIDVMPTVLDLVGLKSPEVVEGQNLVPLLKGQPFKRQNLVMSSRFAAAHPEGIVPENSTDSFAVVNARWKFIYRNKAAKAGIKRVELYDRKVDRGEAHDVANEHPDEVESMIAALTAWIDAQNKVREVIGHTGKSKLDQQTLEKLRSLGYLGGSER